MEQRSSITRNRLLVYLAGLLIYAYAVCLMTKASLGVSPITSIAYILSVLSPMSLGVTQFMVNALLILVQVVWLRREFHKSQYLQFAASIIFSVFIDLMMPLAGMFNAGEMNLAQRALLFLLSMLIMSMGLGTVSIANLVMLPGDGVAKTIAYKLAWPFGKAKVLNDCICVSITCVISLLFLRRIEGVQIGTVVAAVLLGNFARVYIRCAQKPLQRFIAGTQPCNQQLAEQNTSPCCNKGKNTLEEQ